MEPWKKYQEEASGPWNKYREPEDDNLGMMPFVNKAIAETAGAPVDLITGGLNLIPGVDIEEPFGGSKSIERGMGAIGIDLPEEGRVPETIPEHIGRGVGDAASFLIPAGQVVKGASAVKYAGTKAAGTLQKIEKTTGLPGKIATNIWKSIIKHPYLSMISEVTGGAGWGGLTGVGEEQFPDSPAAQQALGMVGGVIGGMAPTLALHAPSAIALRQGKNLLSKMTLPFTEEGAKYRAGKYIKGRVTDPAKTAAELTAETIGDLPPAVQAGEKRLTVLYKSLIGQDPATDAETIETLSKSIIKLEKEMRKLGYGSPELLGEITAKRVAAIELRMNQRIASSMESAQKRIDGLPVAQRKVAESRIVRNELERVGKQVREKNKVLWAEVDKDISVGTDNTRTTYQKFFDELPEAQRTDIPVVVKRHSIITSKVGEKPIGVEVKKLDKSSRAYGRGVDNVYNPPQYGIFVEGELRGHITGKSQRYMGNAEWSVTRIDQNNKVRPMREFFGVSKPFDKAKQWAVGQFTKSETTTVNELQGLRSKLLEVSRKARKDGQWNKARIADDMADAALADMGIVANAATTPEAKVLQTAIAATRNYKTRFENGVVGKILGFEKGGAPAIDPDLTLDISIGRMSQRGSVDIDKVAITPEAQAATKRYLARSFTDYAAKDGTINPVKADRWIKNNEAILDKFPDLQKQVMDISEAQDLANTTRAAMEARMKTLRDPRISNSARFLNAANMNTAVESILKAKDPSSMAGEMVRQARKDASGDAVAGLRGGFIEHLLDKAAIGSFNEVGEQTLSGRTILGLINNHESTLKQVFDPEQIVRMRKIGSELAKIEAFDKSPSGKVEIEMDDLASNALRLWSKIAGAKLGRMMNTGTIQVPGMMVGRAEIFAKHLTKDRAFQMIHDAVLAKDPSLLKALLLPLDKPGARGGVNARMLGERMNLWLGGSGKRVLEDIQNEIDEFEESQNEQTPSPEKSTDSEIPEENLWWSTDTPIEEPGVKGNIKEGVRRYMIEKGKQT